MRYFAAVIRMRGRATRYASHNIARDDRIVPRSADAPVGVLFSRYDAARPLDTYPAAYARVAKFALRVLSKVTGKLSG